MQKYNQSPSKTSTFTQHCAKGNDNMPKVSKGPPGAPQKNEFRIAHARKRENRFCTVAPLTCNPFNPNWISRHLEGTASCTRKCRSRGGTVENVLLSRFCSPLELASFHVYMLVFAHSNETWQSRSLVNGLQLCEAGRSYNETHVTYSSLKTSSR